jgi:hypothetical protein
MKNFILFIVFVPLFSAMRMQAPAPVSNIDDFFRQADQLITLYNAEGTIDYAGIKKDVRLDSVIAYIGRADISKENTNRKKAFLLNSYNLLVIKAVNENPARQVTEVKGFFDSITYKVNGNMTTLNDLETRIRKDFNDPRIHFGLVCAAKSCPPLPPRAFNASSIETVLNDRTISAINSPAFVQIDKKGKKVKVSKIFEWYKADFGGTDATLIEFINKYRTEKVPVKYKVAYLEYNWDLNAK